MRNETPQKYRDMLENYKNKANINIVLDYTNNPKCNEIVSAYLNDSTEYILTCRCDNDDILAKNYIKMMKEQYRPLDKMFIDFTQGYCLKDEDGMLNNYKSRSNHFISYVEKVDSNEKFKTVYYCNHAFAKDFGFIKRINNKKYPLWCEIIHDTNRYNVFQGCDVTDSEREYFNKNFVIKNY